jgi:hypothetical protein
MAVGRESYTDCEILIYLFHTALSVLAKGHIKPRKLNLKKKSNTNMKQNKNTQSPDFHITQEF